MTAASPSLPASISKRFETHIDEGAFAQSMGPFCLFCWQRAEAESHSRIGRVVQKSRDSQDTQPEICHLIEIMLNQVWKCIDEVASDLIGKVGDRN